MKTRYSLIFLILLLAFVFTISALSAAPAGGNPDDGQNSVWEFETVDARDNAGRLVSLALDSNNAPHLTYLERPAISPPHPLEYAHWTGSEWMTETIHPDSGWNSLVIDDTGRPQVSFHHNFSGGLAFAAHDGAGWQVETVDSTATAGFHNSLALDSAGRAHILYTDTSNNALRYAQQNGGGGWDLSTVLTTSDGIAAIDFVLDALDRPHAVYHTFYCDLIMYMECGSALNYVAWDGSQWQDMGVDAAIAPADGGDASLDVSMALDSAGHLHLAYFDISNWSGILKYFYWDGANYEWTTFSADSNQGGGVALALDADGNPHIAYTNGCPPFSACDGELTYARWTGNRWLVDRVPAAGSLWTYLAMELDQQYRPVVAYLEQNQSDLNLARGLLLEPAVFLPMIYNQ